MMKLFEKNVGRMDRIFRIIVGVAIIVAGAAYLPVPWMYLAVLIGMVILFTGLAGTCSLYSLLGMNTSEKAATRASYTSAASSPKPSPKRKKKTA